MIKSLNKFIFLAIPIYFSLGISYDVFEKNKNLSQEKGDMEQMLKGEIIKKKEINEKKVIVLAKGIIVSNVETIRSVLLECDKHFKFIPKYESCEIYYSKNDSIYSKSIVAPPVVSKVEYFLFTNLNFTDSVSIISWRLDSENKHNEYIEDTYGFWKVNSLDKRTHILTLYMDTDFQFHWSINWLFKPILKSLIKKDLPNMIRNVRARVESNETWEIGKDIPKPIIISRKYD